MAATTLTAVAAFALAGCTSGGGTDSGKDEPAGDGVLNLWYGYEPGQADAITELIAQWDEANPDVTVEITAMGPELNPPSLLPALSAGEGPDMWAGTIGSGPSQAFIDAGLVRDLTPYYCDNGWNDVIPDELATIVTTDGKLFGIPNSIESTGVFYRKSIFEQLGLEVPTTWDEFMDVVTTLVENGYETPIGTAGQDAWPVTQLLGAMWMSAVGPDGIEKTLFGDGTWTEDGFQQATQMFADLQGNGYFGPEPLAYTYQAMTADFYNGVVPMTYTGGFVIPGAQEDAGENFDDIGVFALPSVVDGPIYANASPGEGWYVNANSAYADEAADLLNFLFFTDESRTKILEGGLVPVGPVDVSKVELPSVLEELLSEQDKYRENGTVPTFIEVLTPGGIFEVMQTGVQGILAGSTSPDQLTQSIQTAWETEKEAGNTLDASAAPQC